MTGDRSLFLTLTMKEGGTVGFGGNLTWKIIGSGTIGNSSVSINNVWLVDGLKHNLLSISQFCGNGYNVLFVKNNCTVIRISDQSIVFKGKRRNNVYKINFSELTDQKVLCLLSMSDKKWLVKHPLFQQIHHLNFFFFFLKLNLISHFLFYFSPLNKTNSNSYS